MPEKITPELLRSLAMEHPDERLEHLVHPDEPKFEVVVRTPRAEEFKRWKREPDRDEATERIMSLCLVYPSAEEWEAMLNKRPALADTFGQDIPKLVGALPVPQVASCVVEDPKALEPFLEKCDAEDLRVLQHPQYRDCRAILRRPKRDAYKRFKATSSKPGRALDAIETLLLDCVVWPELDDWKALVDRMPGLIDSFGSYALTFAGGSAEFTGKK